LVKILSVFGTRPEAIKMAPVIKEMRNYPDQINCRVCVTAQHRQILDQVLELFEIRPDHDLDVMKDNQSLEYLTATILTHLGEIIEEEKPDYVLVQGDTTTVMSASLSAFYKQVKVGHIEAGLRTYNKWDPYPEEINRKIVDSISDLHFAPTEWAKQNLLREGISEQSIFVTGNTVIDALLDIMDRDFCLSGTPLESIPFNEKRVILVTSHRRENLGEPLRNICQALREIAEQYDNIHIVYPVHLNPNVRKTVYPILGDIHNVSLIEPLDYQSFVYLMNNSHIVLTDSGGLQEEAPSLGKPVLVLREITERPEAIDAGTARLAGTGCEKIVKQTQKLLDDIEEYNKMAKAANPYGDGKASQRIVNCFLGKGSVLGVSIAD